MDYGELKTFFTELLNRNDITETQTDLFISMGLRRTERILRTSMQRQTAEYIILDPWAGYIPVPNDYLGLHFIKVNGVTIRRLADTQAGPTQAGYTDQFYIKNGKFYFQADLKLADVVEVCYYREFIEATTSASITVYSAIIPDVIVYAALVYASDHFTDIRKMNFEETFKVLVSEVQDLSDRDEMSGGQVVANPYAGLV